MTIQEGKINFLGSTVDYQVTECILATFNSLQDILHIFISILFLWDKQKIHYWPYFMDEIERMCLRAGAAAQ